ncbi:ribosomal protein L7/L12 [Amycolatopsis solani]|uniref:ribosomal protein L7/L12 n=1 Tax=Amycolatopsis solani TaxID=3028615 RepID=UPI0025AFCAC2|nr:ribosomal protein L7/L12 [Amycolatopsis sp. MEP2-6]
MSPWAVVVILFAIFAGAVGVKVMRSATLAGADLDEGVIAAFAGLRLTETAVVEGTGDRALHHSAAGLSARVEIRSAEYHRVTVPRVLLLGLLALAVKKKGYESEAHLVVEGPGTTIERAVSLRKHPNGAAEAQEFAEALNQLDGRPAARPADGRERFDVALLDAGASQVEVVRAVRRLVRGIGLLDAKELVTGAPSILLEQVPERQAEAARDELEKAGAAVELL